ncbi:MAG: hypothetical protein M3R59_02035 [Verrucomicrobiota bacterium]|nr:hypothetical protein [Verrucomicrobiota bacterium]
MQNARLPLLVVWFLSLLLGACVTQPPLSSVDRSRYRRMVVDPVEAPEHYVYRDITGQRSRGLMGGLVGLALGAASEGPGFHRFDAAASRQPVDIKFLVRSKVAAALRSSNLFTIVPANGDATLHLKIYGYGVAPLDGRKVGGVISAMATLVGNDGKKLWQKGESGVSQTSDFLEAYETNPGLWRRVADEAADDLARKLILYTEKSERQMSPLAR